MDAAFREITITDFREDRKRGIGGSDVAGVMSLSKWDSPISIWMKKTGRIKGDVDNDYVYWGKTLEPVIIEEFTKRTGLRILNNDNLLQSVEHPFMIANIDGWGIDDDGKKFVLECKTTNAYDASEWEYGKIPVAYELQTLHYLIVTDYSYGYVACLIGGNQWVLRKVSRDSEIEKKIIEAEKSFWESYIIPDVMPPADGADATTDSLTEAYSPSVQNEVDLTPSFYPLLKEREKIIEEIHRLDLKKKEIENKIRSVMQESEKAYCAEYAVSWKTYTRKSLDVGSIRSQTPEIYDRFVKESEYRKFLIKKQEEK